MPRRRESTMKMLPATVASATTCSASTTGNHFSAIDTLSAVPCNHSRNSITWGLSVGVGNKAAGDDDADPHEHAECRSGDMQAGGVRRRAPRDRVQPHRERDRHDEKPHLHV